MTTHITRWTVLWNMEQWLPWLPLKKRFNCGQLIHVVWAPTRSFPESTNVFFFFLSINRCPKKFAEMPKILPYAQRFNGMYVCKLCTKIYGIKREMITKISIYHTRHIIWRADYELLSPTLKHPRQGIS